MGVLPELSTKAACHLSASFLRLMSSTPGPLPQLLSVDPRAHNLQVLHDALATFVKELRAGGPMRDGAAQPKAAAAKPADAAAGSGTSGEAAAPNGGGAAAARGAAPPAGKPKEQGERGGSSGHSIELKERFFAGAAGEHPALCHWKAQHRPASSARQCQPTPPALPHRRPRPSGALHEGCMAAPQVDTATCSTPFLFHSAALRVAPRVAPSLPQSCTSASLLRPA